MATYSVTSYWRATSLVEYDGDIATDTLPDEVVEQLDARGAELYDWDIVEVR